MSGKLDEAIEQIDRMIEGVDDFKAKHKQELATMQEQLDRVETILNRPKGLFGTGHQQPAEAKMAEAWVDLKTKDVVPVLDHKHSVAALEPKAEGDTPSMGRVLRGIILGGHAPDSKELDAERKAMGITPDTGGGYTVPSRLSGEWIDLFRANMVLSKAGVRTVPMDTNSLTLAKLTGDPTVAWHQENASLADSEATLGAVTLSTKTAVCMVKLSLELAQDSANIEQILQTSMTAALAHEVDRCGLVGVTTDAALAPGGVFDLSGRNSVTSIGAPTSWDFLVDGMYELMVDNVPEDSIGAMIGHPAIWKKMTKLKTGITDDNTPLPVPEAVQRIPKLWTTAAPLAGGTTAKAMVARWSDLLMGVRKNIQVHVLREAFLGTNLQVAVLAYVRCDFVATRAQSFCSLEGITV